MKSLSMQKIKNIMNMIHRSFQQVEKQCMGNNPMEGIEKKKNNLTLTKDESNCRANVIENR